MPRAEVEHLSDERFRDLELPHRTSPLATFQASAQVTPRLCFADPCIAPRDADYCILRTMRSSTGSGPRRRSALLLSVGMHWRARAQAGHASSSRRRLLPITAPGYERSSAPGRRRDAYATDPCIAPHDADYCVLRTMRSSTGSGPRRRSALLLSVGMHWRARAQAGHASSSRRRLLPITAPGYERSSAPGRRRDAYATDPCIAPHDADYCVLRTMRSSTGSGPRRRSALLLSVGMQ